MLMTPFSACGQSTCRSPWHRGASVPRQWGVPHHPPSAEAVGRQHGGAAQKLPWSGRANYVHHTNGSALMIMHAATYGRRYLDFTPLKLLAQG